MSVRRASNSDCQASEQPMPDDEREWLLAPWKAAAALSRNHVKYEAGCSVDIYEDDQKIYVDVEMPGFRIADADITLTDRILAVSGNRVEKETKGQQRLPERWRRTIQRCFSLPCHVEQGVEASLIDGVLRLELHKCGGVQGDISNENYEQFLMERDNLAGELSAAPGTSGSEQ
jgi:HSP20 family molecular chaperone IbpA